MDNFLQINDYVGVSFWIVSVAMVASTVFFLYEGIHVKSSWRLSMLVVVLVTLIATIKFIERKVPFYVFYCYKINSKCRK